MTSPTSIRWSGTAVMVGGLLSVLFSFVAEPQWTHVSLDAARHALMAVGVVVIYLHLRQAPRFGWVER